MLRFDPRSLLVGVAIAAGASLLGRSAQAQPSPLTRGEKLFREGRDAMAARDFVTACGKFDESYALEHVVTSLLNEADCEEKRGRIATSLRLWKEGSAKADDDAVKKLCAEHIAALEPRVPRLDVHIGQVGLAGVTLTVDGAPFVAGTPMPIDPGVHDVGATAPGRPAETQHVRIDEASTKTITVLATVTATEPPVVGPRAKPEESSSGSGVRTAGFVTGGVGLAGLVLFGATGIAVLTNHDDCPHYECPSSKRPTGLLAANAAGLVVGVVGVVVGTTLIIVGGSKKEAPKAALWLGASPSLSGASFSSRF